MVGESGKKYSYFVFEKEVGHYQTWYLITFLCQGWEIQLPLIWSYLSESVHIGLLSRFESNVPKSVVVVTNMFKRSLHMVQTILGSLKPSITSTILESVLNHSSFILQILILVSCCRPSYDRSLLIDFITSSMKLSRNPFQYLGACMPQWHVSLLSMICFHYRPLIKWLYVSSTLDNLFTCHSLY